MGRFVARSRFQVSQANIVFHVQWTHPLPFSSKLHTHRIKNTICDFNNHRIEFRLPVDTDSPATDIEQTSGQFRIFFRVAKRRRGDFDFAA